MQKTVSENRWRIPGFEVVSVPMNGDCMFHSIAHQLYVLGVDAAQRPATDVRRELVEYLRGAVDMHSIINAGLDEKDTLYDYLYRMSLCGTWGDGNMLSAACRLYHLQVHMYYEGRSVPVVFGDIHVGSDNDRKINIAFVSEIPGKDPSHYLSLLPVDLPATEITTTSTVNNLSAASTKVRD